MIDLLLLLLALQTPIRQVSNANIVVHYPSTMDESAAKDYLSGISQIFYADTSKFKMKPEGELAIRLCTDKYEFSDLTGLDSIFSPLWKDGTLFILNRGDPSDTSFRRLLEAGVIRAMLDPLRQNGAPLWLINSAASYISGRYTDCPSPVIENVEYFADLDEKIVTVSSSTELCNLSFYLGTTGKFFDNRFGDGALLKLIQEFQHETSLDEAIENVFHSERSQLERDWRDYLASEVNSK